MLLFLGRPGPVVHRVIGHRGGALVTKGDNRPAPDRANRRPPRSTATTTPTTSPGTTSSTSGAGPRLYALGAAAISLAGGWGYRLASVVDAVLRRLVPGAGDVRLARPVAWFVQRGVRAAFHVLFFRPCHGAGVPVAEDPEDEDR